MHIMTKRTVPRYQRENVVSHLLVSQVSGGAENLSVTLVEMEPGGVQALHAHAPEQMYYILDGHGLMTVDDEQREVSAGDCIFFPAFVRHALVNTGETVLRYLSAASPPFTREESAKIWPLPSLEDEERQAG